MHKPLKKHKLTAAQVLEIRQAMKGELNKLADKFGVSNSTLCKAYNGFTYKRVANGNT